MSLHKITVFTGVATALITPHLGGEIDYDAFGNLIDLQIGAGIGALLVAGTTGESATLRRGEFAKLIAYAKARIDGRVPLLVGCGSNSTEHTLELADIACREGADALLAVTPYYNKASDRGILLHYRALADHAARPVILYNVPARTGFSMTMAHYRELAKHENIVGVKEASGNLGLVEALCAECGDDLDVYTGNDDQIVASMKVGGQGVVSVCSNILPRETIELCRLCASGDWRAAGQRQRALLPQIQALFREVNPIPVKYVASLKGLCAAEYRLPLCPPSPETAKLLQSLFYK